MKRGNGGVTAGLEKILRSHAKKAAVGTETNGGSMVSSALAFRFSRWREEQSRMDKEDTTSHEHF